MEENKVAQITKREWGYNAKFSDIRNDFDEIVMLKCSACDYKVSRSDHLWANARKRYNKMRSAIIQHFNATHQQEVAND